MNLINKPRYTSVIVFTTIIIGLIAGTILTMLILYPNHPELASGVLNKESLSRNETILSQLISMIMVFGVPPLLFAIFTKNSFYKLYEMHIQSKLKAFLFAIPLATLLFPIVINFRYLTSIIDFPEAIKKIVLEQDEQTEFYMELFLNYPGLGNFILMVVMVGIMAGVLEELFFRGYLMPMIEKWTKSTWAAIILSAIIFSVFHGNINNFLPIALVGGIFGYIYSKTKDLKLNMFIHAFYNSFQVTLNYLFINKKITQDIDKVEFVPWYIWIICVALAFYFINLIIKKYADISHEA